MNLPSISIIVPVYNAEDTLRQCIDSIIQQTFNDWELLLINDGSKDKSGDICDEYVLSHKQIKVLHKPNTGVSDSRNCALDMAIGKYVIFVDADDYWSTNTALEQLFSVAEENSLDIVRGEYYILNEQGVFHCSRKNIKFNVKYINRLISTCDFLKYAIHGEFFLWLCLIRKEIIGDLRFEVGMIFLEDMQFLSKLMAKNIRCMYVPMINFYIYRTFSNSASNRFLPQRIHDILKVSSTLYILSENIKDALLKDYLIDKSIRLYYLSISYLSLDEYYIDKELYITKYSIDEIRINVVKRIIVNKKFFLSPVYYLPAITGVRILRLRILLSKIKYALLKNIKKG